MPFISFILSLDRIDCSTFPVHTYILTPFVGSYAYMDFHHRTRACPSYQKSRQNGGLKIIPLQLETSLSVTISPTFLYGTYIERHIDISCSMDGLRAIWHTLLLFQEKDPLLLQVFLIIHRNLPCGPPRGPPRDLPRDLPRGHPAFHPPV